MNLNYRRDQDLSVAPAVRPDMRDAVRPFPPNPQYPDLPDYPRSTLKLSATHCLQTPSDVIVTALERYTEARLPGGYHPYIVGNNTDDIGKDAPLPIDRTRSSETTDPFAPRVLALNRHNQEERRTLPDNDDDVPDLLSVSTPVCMSTSAMEQLSHDTAAFQMSLLSGSVQPFNRGDGEFHTFELSNEDRIGTLPSSNSINPLSVNFNHNINTSHNSTAYWSTISINMNPRPSVYWSDTGVDQQQSPERILRAMVRRSLAIHSPNLTRRLYAHHAALALLPPLDEIRIREWLRELYPYEFRAYYFFEVDQDSSLELEEIRYLFQALLNGFILREWFRTSTRS